MFEDDPLWYKDAIIYELHVKAFFDSSNDGIGDFRGLTQKLAYIRDLGVNALWLLPFYPSPMRDDGYDISDYHRVHPDYGTMADFRRLVREAHRLGLKVITELVINHTSDQHPWFQAARHAPPRSAKRDYYVWSKTNKKFPETRVIFTDAEKSNWTWDDTAQAYYWHRFFFHQPDLNHNNPHVVKAMMRAMRFWLDAGVDGLRLDAIPYLCVREGTGNENLPETHAVIRYMRTELDQHYRGRMFLAEANQWPEDVREYFGDGDECHMAYHFPLMPRLYMAIAQEDRHPIIEIMQQTPDIPANCQWAIFLRNHDELTLEMVTDRERDYLYQTYAADPRTRLNVGIRRRLAPLMDNDRHKIELLNSLLMSMPGSPILYYGDEIGMGDNVYLGDRNGVRTPMQWSPDRNAGFSRADPARLYLPPIMDPVYGYEALNVEAQSHNTSSLLNWTRRLIAVRKTYRAFGRGSLNFLHPGNRKILAYLRAFEEDVILCVANLSRSAQPVELDLSAHKGRVPLELMARTAFPPVGDLPYLLTLPGYGFYWFRLATDAEVPSWHEERRLPPDLPVLVLPQGWRTFFALKEGAARDVHSLTANRSRQQLEQDILPAFLARQRWFAAKGETLAAVTLTEPDEWTTEQGSWLLSCVEARCADGGIQTYFLPLAIAWGEDEADRQGLLAPWTLAKVRQQARMGMLLDAFGDEAFCRALVTAMGDNLEIPFGSGRLRFSAGASFRELLGGEPQPVCHSGGEPGDTAVALGHRLFLKSCRRLQHGGDPGVEIGRFLTEVSPFPNIAPLVGAAEYTRGSDDTVTLALLQKYVANQGNAWTYTLDYLQRFFETRLAPPLRGEPGTEESPHGLYLALADTLGRRTGELHRALAKASGDPAFDPEPISPEDPASWVEQVRAETIPVLDELERERGELPDGEQEQAKHLLARRASILDYMEASAYGDVKAIKIRYHGDFHLGRVLLVQNDFVIIDFQSEPGRPPAERRAKHSPLRDVAGMLCSLHHAAAEAMAYGTAERPQDKALLKPFARAWEREAGQAFLAGYRAGAAGCGAWPENPAHGAGLIRLFVLEKMLYALRCELDRRPAKTDVALSGLLELLDAEAVKEGMT